MQSLNPQQSLHCQLLNRLHRLNSSHTNQNPYFTCPRLHRLNSSHTNQNPYFTCPRLHRLNSSHTNQSPYFTCPRLHRLNSSHTNQSPYFTCPRLHRLNSSHTNQSPYFTCPRLHRLNSSHTNQSPYFTLPPSPQTEQFPHQPKPLLYVAPVSQPRHRLERTVPVGGVVNTSNYLTDNAHPHLGGPAPMLDVLRRQTRPSPAEALGSSGVSAADCVDSVLLTASLAKWLRRPPREWKIRGSNPAGDGIFFRVESYQWLKNWHSSGYPARRLAL